MQRDPRAYLWDVREAAVAARVPSLPQIVAFRNQLIHGYARVNHDTVWNVVHDSLPVLLACMQSLLQEMGEDKKNV